MALDKLNAIHPADFLECLKDYSALKPFRLALYCEEDELLPEGNARFQLCSVLDRPPLCDGRCKPIRDGAIKRALVTKVAEAFSCPSGLLNFVVPFSYGRTGRYCLLGGGIRENSKTGRSPVNLRPNETLDSLLLRDAQEPTTNLGLEQIKELALRVQKTLPVLLKRNLHALTLEKTSHRIKALTEITAEIDAAADAEEVIALLSETLAVLFNLPRIAVALAEGEGAAFSVKGVLGLALKQGSLPTERVAELLKRQPGGRPILLYDEIAALFPGVQSSQTICAPLHSEGKSLGLVIMFNAQLHQRDLLLLELLTGRAASRLLHLKRMEEHLQENAFSSRLVKMISDLSGMQTRQEIHHNIVEMAAELLNAARGSLMLLDADGENLRIESAKGMNPSLARSLNVRIGTGIAGKVAKSGLPLVVNDIEKDRRIGIPNRPRFKTKSFISIPLKQRQQVIGVLNLSDKENQGIFTEKDLQLLNHFVAQTSTMLERAASVERSNLLEELAATDPLTGLYNRRFLDKRLDEELNRGLRHQLGFTIMVIDLDNFKLYNDLCGHLAGDQALKRVAALLKASARKIDIVARYGGEEFLVILPGTSKKEANFVAERIRRAIESESFPGEIKLPQRSLTASIGLSSFPRDGETVSALINAADVALYRAKNQGRNRVHNFDEIAQKNPIAIP